MSFQVFGIPVSRGVAIGRAVLVASSRVDVAHYFVEAGQVPAELARLRQARNAVVEELHRLQVEMRRGLFALEKDLPPVDVMFLYQIIDWVTPEGGSGPNYQNL